MENEGKTGGKRPKIEGQKIAKVPVITMLLGLLVCVLDAHFQGSETTIKLHNFKGLKLFNFHNEM